MKIGRCIRISPLSREREFATHKDPAHWLETLEQELDYTARLGFDFAELPLSVLAELPEVEFKQALDVIVGGPLACEAVNSLLPASLPIVGSAAANQEAVDRYLQQAFGRAKAMGAKVINFGGGRVRQIPEGFDRVEATGQLSAFLQRCEVYAEQYGMLVAVEALNRKECNLLKYVEEAVELVASLYLPHLRVVADSYHMLVQREDSDILEDAIEMGLLVHVHLADKERRLPGVEEVERGVDWPTFISRLKHSGFTGRASLECEEPILQREEALAESLAYLRGLWNTV